jgi:hypothetical protein
LGSDVAVGTYVPNYRNLISTKASATSAYNRTLYNVNQAGYFDAHVRQISNHKNYTKVWGWKTGADATANNTTNDFATSEIALSKIRSKIESDEADFAVMENLLQDAYEFRRTINDGLDSTRDLLRNVAGLTARRSWRGRYSRKDIVKNVADLYLTYVFGINPTIEDAKNLAASIDSYLKREDRVKHFHAQHYTDSTAGKFTSKQSLATGINIELTSMAYRRYSVRFIDAHLFNVVSGNNYAALSEHFHLAPTDFIPMAWELLPWSWLGDYVATMGDLIHDTFQSNTDRSIYACKNVKIEHNVITSARLIPTAGWEMLRCESRPNVLSTGAFARIPINGLPTRSFRFRSDAEIQHNSTKKLANIMAVIIGRSK